MFTREELLKMPLRRLRLIDIQSVEEEKIVQEVVDIKVAQEPPAMEISRIDVPDITTPEQEKHWQKIIDERSAKLKPSVSNQSAPIQLKEEKTIETTSSKISAPQVNPDAPKVELNPLQCPQCEFKGKNSNGVRLHFKKHK